MTDRQKDVLPFHLFRQKGFAIPREEDDLLYPEYTGIVATDTLTETQFRSFIAREDGVFGVGNLFYHPNLGSLVGAPGLGRVSSATLLHVRFLISEPLSRPGA